jgi:hypothetical protein
MGRPRAADDFAAIRARMKELEREREQVACGGEKKPSDARRWPINGKIDESGKRAGDGNGGGSCTITSARQKS